MNFQMIQSIISFVISLFQKKAAGPATPPPKAEKKLNIIWDASPNFSDRLPGAKITAIILHHTGPGGLQATISWFHNPESKVSAHYVVDKDGTIYQMVKDELRAWHAGESSLNGEENVNRFSIGIEMVSDGKEGFTDAQYEKTAALCFELQQKYPLITDDRIKGHKDICPGRKVDPSPWDWDRFFTLLHKQTS